MPNKKLIIQDKKKILSVKSKVRRLVKNRKLLSAIQKILALIIVLVISFTIFGSVTMVRFGLLITGILALITLFVLNENNLLRIQYGERGVESEEAFFKFLQEKLPKGWHFTTNFLWEKRGPDVDVLVISPQGSVAFCIELKDRYKQFEVDCVQKKGKVYEWTQIINRRSSYIRSVVEAGRISVVEFIVCVDHLPNRKSWYLNNVLVCSWTSAVQMMVNSYERDHAFENTVFVSRAKVSRPVTVDDPFDVLRTAGWDIEYVSDSNFSSEDFLVRTPSPKVTFLVSVRNDINVEDLCKKKSGSKEYMLYPSVTHSQHIEGVVSNAVRHRHSEILIRQGRNFVQGVVWCTNGTLPQELRGLRNSYVRSALICDSQTLIQTLRTYYLKER